MERFGQGLPNKPRALCPSRPARSAAGALYGGRCGLSQGDGARSHHARLRFNLGLAYFKAGEYKDALQQFQPLIKTETPDSEEAQRLTILIGMSHYGWPNSRQQTPI